MASDNDTLFTKALKDSGSSVTAARKLVFGLMLGAEPQSMHELFERTAGKIDRASLYRVIDLFERIGIAQRVSIGWKYKIELTDLFHNHHHHISCLHCGKIMAIHEDEQIENLIKEFSEKYEITVERHQLEIQGYCKTCQLFAAATAGQTPAAQ